MAAKPKLTQGEWDNVRKVWESDPRKGFAWIIKELELPVSEEALRLRSKKEGWVKGGKPSLENAKPKLGESKKTKLGKSGETIQKPSQKKPEAEEVEWEEVVEEKRPAHRQTLFKHEYVEQAYNYCLLGATDEKLAEFFKVDVRTIYNWKNDHPEFFQALEDGKHIANAQIARALFERAKGYTHKELKVAQFEGGFITMEVDKHYPPDVAAAKVFLYNRDPENWKDKQEVVTTHKLDKEMLDNIKVDFITRLEKARERQRQVLIDRGILDEEPGAEK